MHYNKDKKRERKNKGERKMAIKVYGLTRNYNNYTYYRNPKGEVVKTYGTAYSDAWRRAIDKDIAEKNAKKEEK